MHKIVYYIYPDTYHFYCSFFIPDVPSVFQPYGPLSISNSFKAGLLAMHSLSLPYSKIFISHVSLKGIFTWYRILGWQFFIISTLWNVLPLSFVIPGFWWETHILIVVFIINVLFSSGCPPIFLFVFSFQQFDYGMCGHLFPWVYRTWGFLSFLNL